MLHADCNRVFNDEVVPRRLMQRSVVRHAVIDIGEKRIVCGCAPEGFTELTMARREEQFVIKAFLQPYSEEGKGTEIVVHFKIK